MKTTALAQIEAVSFSFFLQKGKDLADSWKWLLIITHKNRSFFGKISRN